MHSAIKKYLVFLIIFTSMPTLGDEEKSTCLPSEYTYFSCATASGKILSICGVETNKELQEISYRFGSYKKIELSYPPKGTINPKSKFTYNNYFRSMTSYFRFNFKNGNYNYSVFRDYDGEISNTQKAGVIVTKVDSTQKKETIINCKNIINDETQKLTKYLTCDTDSALGCSR